jgi:hypothetical protein
MKDKRIKFRVPLPKQTEKIIPDETKYKRKKGHLTYEELEDARDIKAELDANNKDAL